MAKKKAARKKSAARQSRQPRSFSGLIKGRTRPVQALATGLRELLYEELPDAQESFHGGHQPIAMYRTIAEIYWIQPLTSRCNVYFTRGTELTDNDGILEGTSCRFRFVKVPTIDAIEQFPLREWIRESVALNVAATGNAITVDEVLEKMRAICLTLPQTKETLTWGQTALPRGREDLLRLRRTARPCESGSENGASRVHTADAGPRS